MDKVDLQDVPMVENGEFSIIKLLPEQISEHWGLIASALGRTVPREMGEEARVVNNILHSLIDESMQCWFCGKYEEGGLETYVIIITGVITNMGTNERCLMIYTVYWFQPPPNALWESGLNVLRKYARSQGCSKIVAYSKFDMITNLVKALGGDVSWKYLQIEV